MQASTTLEILSGAALLPHLDDVARLRIAVFRDWPYLYDGTLDSLEQIADVVRDCVDATHLVDLFTVLARRLGVRVDDVTVVAVRRTA